MLKQIIDQKELDNKKDKLIVIDFFAPWCGPCKILMPFIEDLATDFENNKRVEIFKINVDDSQELARKYDIMSVPTLLFLQNGKVVDFLPGFTSKESIIDRIDILLGGKIAHDLQD